MLTKRLAAMVTVLGIFALINFAPANAATAPKQGDKPPAAKVVKKKVVKKTPAQLKAERDAAAKKKADEAAAKVKAAQAALEAKRLGDIKKKCDADAWCKNVGRPLRCSPVTNGGPGAPKADICA